MKISLDSQIDLDEVIKMNMHNLFQVILKVDIYMGVKRIDKKPQIILQLRLMLQILNNISQFCLKCN